MASLRYFSNTIQQLNYLTIQLSESNGYIKYLRKRKDEDNN